MTPAKRDHGGGLDAAIARFGGTRAGWIDLSTGINPEPYPAAEITADAWTALPDAAAQGALNDAARHFWRVPPDAAILAAPGASILIAQIPWLVPAGTVHIPGPTYNEHAAAFAGAGWRMGTPDAAQARVAVHPNNPDGALRDAAEMDAPLTVIDESFCDTVPGASLMPLAARPGTLILKSFGKFWGLAGLRLGFAIGDPALVARLADRLGPWPVSGPALAIGAAALRDTGWADAARLRLARDSQRLDAAATRAGARVRGGTTLFRLYEVDDAAAWQDRLARHRIWSRTFPYDPRWLRLGLPPADGWARLEAALA